MTNDMNDKREGLGDKIVSIALSNDPSELSNFETLDENLSSVQMDLLLIWMSTSYRTAKEIHKEYETRWTDRCPSLQVVSRQLRNLRRKTLIFSRDILRDQLLFEYEILYKEAYQSWLDSKEDFVTITEKREESDKGYKESTVEKRQGQTGDPAHWNNAQKALAAIREMAGVDEPKRVENIIRHEMDLVLQYLEISLTGETFGEVMKAFVQYDVERDTVIDY